MSKLDQLRALREAKAEPLKHPHPEPQIGRPAKLKFDRNAYQRDLMRKRRAANKPNKTGS